MDEIRKGIEKGFRLSRSAELEAFIAATTKRFSGRIIPFDAADRFVGGAIRAPLDHTAIVIG